MHIFICLTSLFLTFHLSSPRASSFYLLNVQGSNFSQNASQKSVLESTTLDTRSTSIPKQKELESDSELFTSTQDFKIERHFVLPTTQNKVVTTSTLPAIEEFSQTSTTENADVTRNTLSAIVPTDALSMETLKDVLSKAATESTNTSNVHTKVTEYVTKVGIYEKKPESPNIAKGEKLVDTTKSVEKVKPAESASRAKAIEYYDKKKPTEWIDEAKPVDTKNEVKTTESVVTSNTTNSQYAIKDVDIPVNMTSEETEFIRNYDNNTKDYESTKAITLKDTTIKAQEFEDATIKLTELPIITVNQPNDAETLTNPSPNLENNTQRIFNLKTEDTTNEQKESELPLTSATETVILTTEHDATAQNTFIASEVNLKIPYTYDKYSAEANSEKNLSVYSITTINDSSISDETVTSFEETFEHNAILTTDIDTITDRYQNIVVGHKCTRIFQESILWNVTDGGMLALKSCPSGYQGNMYRPCFSNGKWGNVDYSECRLEHLGRMRHMIFHQVQKGMIGNMYVLADEFSKYISSVDMKSPMDRLEAFETLNTFLKLDMTLKMDKSRDMKYIQTLLYSCNELIKKKTVLFSPGSQKNKLITEKAVEMIFDLTSFAEKALRGLLKTQKKQIAFRSTSNVVLYLYRGKLSRQFQLMNFSNEFERDDELSSYFNLEKTLERSAYALIWVKGLHDLLSTEDLLVDSDIAVATILSPLNSLNHMMHPPTFDIGLRLRKEIPHGYRLKCGQLWNMSHLWNTDDCIKATRKEDIVTCRCHHLGSISLLLEELPQITSTGPSPPVGKLITVSCVTSLSATLLTLVINFLIRRRDQSLSIFILINLLVCLAAIQVTFMMGVNKTERFEVCLSFAVLLHYLFLVSCFWVVSYSIYLLRRLRSCMEYVGKFRDYCAISWLLPSVLLIISFIGNPNEYETKHFCWLNVQKGILWSFVVPVTGLILVNTIVMIMALKIFQDQMSVTHKLEICKTRNSMRAGVTLLPYFAINWFFGILAVENSDNMILQVVFSFTNSMQGILTFVFFCIMDNNVQMLFRLKFYESSKKPKVSSMRLRKSGSFPILEKPLMTLTDDSRRHDCTPLLCERSTYHDAPEDPCCSNIRV